MIKILENNREFSIKINLYFSDTFKLFFKRPIENKIFDDKLKEGLIDYEQYFLSGKHSFLFYLITQYIKNYITKIFNKIIFTNIIN